MLRSDIPASEIRQAVNVAQSIPGMFRRFEAAFLYRLAASCPGQIVEIGCYLGRSTSLLVQATRQHGGRVLSIDPFSAMPAGIKPATLDGMLANLSKHQLPAPEVWEMTSDEGALRWQADPQPIALLFVDGLHSRAQVYRDLERWAPYVQPGGVVALHDCYHPNCPEVILAVAEWWAANRWQLLGLHDYTLAFMRREHDA